MRVTHTRKAKKHDKIKKKQLFFHTYPKIVYICIMNENDRTVIANFEEKLHRLAYEYKLHVERNKELTAMVQQKENALKELELRCVALEKNYNNLKQAKILSLNDQAVDETKERISKLVREIDRCIESLKK